MELMNEEGEIYTFFHPDLDSLDHLERGLPTFSIKGQLLNTVGFAGQCFVTTTQFCF